MLEHSKDGSIFQSGNADNASFAPVACLYLPLFSNHTYWYRKKFKSCSKVRHV